MKILHMLTCTLVAACTVNEACAMNLMHEVATELKKQALPEEHYLFTEHTIEQEKIRAVPIKKIGALQPPDKPRGIVLVHKVGQDITVGIATLTHVLQEDYDFYKNFANDEAKLRAHFVDKTSSMQTALDMYRKNMKVLQEKTTTAEKKLADIKNEINKQSYFYRTIASFYNTRRIRTAQKAITQCLDQKIQMHKTFEEKRNSALQTLKIAPYEQPIKRLLENNNNVLSWVECAQKYPTLANIWEKRLKGVVAYNQYVIEIDQPSVFYAAMLIRMLQQESHKHATDTQNTDTPLIEQQDTTGYVVATETVSDREIHELLKLTSQHPSYEKVRACGGRYFFEKIFEIQQ